MSTMIKVYTAIFLVLMAVFVSIGILSAQVDIQNAQDYHAAVINEIENSNHSPSVIEACKQEAAKNGYTLEIVSYPNATKVILKYKYTVSFLNIQSDKQIEGYAR